MRGGILNVPLRTRIDAETRRIAKKTAVGLTEPVANRAVVILPQYIIAGVAVEVSDSDDVPTR